MAKTMETVTVYLPVSVTFDGKQIEVGTISLDLKVAPSGRVKIREEDVKRALRKVR
jgi:hypothetical protein